MAVFMFLVGGFTQTLLLAIVPAVSIITVIITLYLGLRKLRVETQVVTDAKGKQQADRDAKFIDQQQVALKELQDTVEHDRQRSRLLEDDIRILRADNRAKDQLISEHERKVAQLTAELATCQVRITEVERRNRILEEAYKGQTVIETQITSIHAELEALRRAGTAS